MKYKDIIKRTPEYVLPANIKELKDWAIDRADVRYTPELSYSEYKCGFRALTSLCKFTVTIPGDFWRKANDEETKKYIRETYEIPDDVLVLYSTNYWWKRRFDCYIVTSTEVVPTNLKDLADNHANVSIGKLVVDQIIEYLKGLGIPMEAAQHSRTDQFSLRLDTDAICEIFVNKMKQVEKELKENFPCITDDSINYRRHMVEIDFEKFDFMMGKGEQNANL